MIKYRAIRKSHGYQRRYWEEGDIVEVDENAEQPPHHFVRIDGGEVLKAEVVDAMKPEDISTMSALSQIKPIIPKGGFASSIPPPDEGIIGKNSRKKNK